MSTKKARYTIFHNNHLFLSTGKTERLKRATKVIQKLITFGVHFRLNARPFLLFAVQIDLYAEVFD